MSKIKYFLALTLFCKSFYLFGQNPENTDNDISITDSSLVLGVVSEDYCSICEYISSYCSCFSKTLNKGTIVVVAGATACEKSYSDNGLYFEILHKNKTFYIKKSGLSFAQNIDCFSEIAKFSKEQKDTFRRNAQFTASVIYNKSLDEISSFLKSTKSKGVAILQWNIFDESEYTDGTGLEIEFYNTTNKSIKYITTTIVGYNSVGDKVFNVKKKTYNCQVKSIGPIEPESSGSYKFNYVWFSDIVQTAKVTNVIVQYMDGTIKNITNPENVILKKSLYDFINEE